MPFLHLKPKVIQVVNEKPAPQRSVIVQYSPAPTKNLFPFPVLIPLPRPLHRGQRRKSRERFTHIAYDLTQNAYVFKPHPAP